MTWKKELITLDNDTQAQAQAPVIISASRSTDIPTFYSDWFISRWQKGISNGQILLMENHFMYHLKIQDV